MLNKLLTKLQKKYSKNPLFQKDGFLAPADEKELPQKIKFPMFRIMFSPFNQILDNGKVFFLLSLSGALLICIAATLLGFNYLCTYSAGSSEQIFCSNSLGGYIIYNMIKMLIWSYVGIKWYEYTYNGEKLCLKSMCRVDRRYLKFAGFLLLFLLLNMLPMLSWWILYIRVPNPNWQIEMVFFAFVSIGFIIPIILLRFYASLGFVLRGKKFPAVSYIWSKTTGNTLKIFLSFMLILIISMFIFGNLYTNFKMLTAHININNMLISEYIYDFFALFIYLCIINNLNMQYQIFYGEEETTNAGN